MSWNETRSRIVWPATCAALLLAALSWAPVHAKFEGLAPVTVSECRGASYFDPAKKDLCAAEAIDAKPCRIETIEQGRTALAFRNQTKVTIYAKSAFRIDKYSEQNGLIATLLAGRIRYESPKKIGSADTISGPSLRLEHIGTTFVFSVDSRRRESRRPVEGKGPPGDRDLDSVLDREDSCPKQPGAPDANPALNGCPPMVERVVLLPDADGRVGTLFVRHASGRALAKLDEPYRSLGVTADGEVVRPVVLDRADPDAAAPAPSSAALPTAPFCVDKTHRHCCSTASCDGRSCCWVFDGNDLCRADPGWSLERCFRMDAVDRGGGGEGNGLHFQWAPTADSRRQDWTDLGCRRDARGDPLCVPRSRPHLQPGKP